MLSASSNSSIIKATMQPKIFQVPSTMNQENDQRHLFKNTAIQRLSNKNRSKSKRSSTALCGAFNSKKEDDILEKLQLK